MRTSVAASYRLQSGRWLYVMTSGLDSEPYTESQSRFDLVRSRTVAGLRACQAAWRMHPGRRRSFWILVWTDCSIASLKQTEPRLTLTWAFSYHLHLLKSRNFVQVANRIWHDTTFFFFLHSWFRASWLLINSNEMQQYAGVYLLQNYSTCFGCLSHPSSGVHQTVTAASCTGHGVRAWPN